MKNIAPRMEIPAYVSSWTDEFFHKSAFDVPVKYPNKKVVSFLSKFKRNEHIKLYRGVNKYNERNESIVSWTYDKETADGYINESGKIIEREFAPEDILFDTTMLNREQKRLLGYDYKVDDKEVLVIGVR